MWIEASLDNMGVPDPQFVMKEKILELNDKFELVLKECPEIVFIGDKVLRQKTDEVSVSEGAEIGKRLQSVLAKYRKITGLGRGLAAPQIGENKSVFITYVDNQFKTYINPKIIQKSSDCNLYKEACISCGFIWCDVKRARSVKLEYQDEKGDKKTEELDSFCARLIQHEYDHLQGVVNIDVALPKSIEFMLSDPLKEQLRDC